MTTFENLQQTILQFFEFFFFLREYRTTNHGTKRILVTSIILEKGVWEATTQATRIVPPTQGIFIHCKRKNKNDSRDFFNGGV
jgi:hypothetical protein